MIFQLVEVFYRLCLNWRIQKFRGIWGRKSTIVKQIIFFLHFAQIKGAFILRYLRWREYAALAIAGRTRAYIHPPHILLVITHNKGRRAKNYGNPLILEIMVQTNRPCAQTAGRRQRPCSVGSFQLAVSSDLQVGQFLSLC